MKHTDIRRTPAPDRAAGGRGVHGNYQQLQTKHYHPEEQGAVGRSRANQMLRIVSFDGHIVTLRAATSALLAGASWLADLPA